MHCGGYQTYRSIEFWSRHLTIINRSSGIMFCFGLFFYVCMFVAIAGECLMSWFTRRLKCLWALKSHAFANWIDRSVIWLANTVMDANKWSHGKIIFDFILFAFIYGIFWIIPLFTRQENKNKWITKWWRESCQINFIEDYFFSTLLGIDKIDANAWHICCAFRCGFHTHTVEYGEKAISVSSNRNAYESGAKCQPQTTITISH